MKNTNEAKNKVFRFVYFISETESKEWIYMLNIDIKVMFSSVGWRLLYDIYSFLPMGGKKAIW